MFIYCAFKKWFRLAAMVRGILSFIFVFISTLSIQAQTSQGTACKIGLNNGFEIPLIPKRNYALIDQSLVPNWTTTAPDGMIEIWSSGFNGVPSYEGNQFAELNANYESTLIKTFTARAGVPLVLKFAHRGRNGIDIMGVEVGPVGGPYISLGTFSDNNIAWGAYSIPFIPTVSGPYQLRFVSIIAAGGIQSVGNFIDGVDPGAASILSVISPPKLICPGNTLVLDGSASSKGVDINYFWSTADGIIGTANTSITSISKPGTYTLTVSNPTIAGCSDQSVVVVQAATITTTSFTAAAPICAGNSQFVLPTISKEGITGGWSPAFNNQLTTTYTFTPNAGQCAITATATVTVNPNVPPTFVAVVPICAGGISSPLPTVSLEGITGSWSPAFNNQLTTTYTFTPNAGQCAITATATVTINPNILPTFAAFIPICAGSLSISPLPTVSTEGITGSWSPAFNNQLTTTYTFTPNLGQCAATATAIIAINPNILPAFVMATSVCMGSILLPLPTSSIQGIKGIWSPAFNNQSTTAYTFTPNIGQCATTATAIVVVDEKPVFSLGNDTFICKNETLLLHPLLNTQVNNYVWQDGSANQDYLVKTPGTYILTTLNECGSFTKNIKIAIGSCNILMPSAFTPNNDGLNDVLKVKFPIPVKYFEMMVFNRWGHKIFGTNNIYQGWDGTFEGIAQPADAYLWSISLIDTQDVKQMLNGTVILIR